MPRFLDELSAPLDDGGEQGQQQPGLIRRALQNEIEELKQGLTYSLDQSVVMTEKGPRLLDQTADENNPGIIRRAIQEVADDMIIPVGMVKTQDKDGNIVLASLTDPNNPGKVKSLMQGLMLDAQLSIGQAVGYDEKGNPMIVDLNEDREPSLFAIATQAALAPIRKDFAQELAQAEVGLWSNLKQDLNTYLTEEEYKEWEANMKRRQANIKKIKDTTGKVASATWDGAKWVASGAAANVKRARDAFVNWKINREQEKQSKVTDSPGLPKGPKTRVIDGKAKFE